MRKGKVRLGLLFVGLVVAAVLVSAAQLSAGGSKSNRNLPPNGFFGGGGGGKNKPAPSPEEQRRIREGFDIAPVQLNLKGKNHDLVGLGSYIVNAQGGCNDCHTAPPYKPGHDPFMGQEEEINTTNYLAGGQQFGPFTSRNITPNANGKPAGMDFDEFLNVMRTGEDDEQEHPQISPLLQVMPWPTYGKMTDRDLRAVYEYLRSIPHAEPPVP